MENESTSSDDLVSQWALRKLSVSDYTLGNLELSAQCPLDDGQRSIGATQSLGSLSCLPLEILTPIFLRLDILSLVAVRQVNKRAMQTVGSVPQYRTMYELCPDILRAIISTEARHFTLDDLYKTLRRRQCEACGDFGGYIYVVTCTRVCYVCFTEDRRFWPYTGRAAAAATGLSQAELSHLPHVRGIPGRYVDRGQVCRWAPALWDRGSILPIRSAETRHEKIDIKSGDPRRFMAVVPAPYLDLQPMRVQWVSTVSGVTNPASEIRISGSSIA